MNIKLVFLLIGIILIVLKWQRLILVNNWWIVLCFFVWTFGIFWSIHNKNKEGRTPKPVYLTNQK